MPGGPTDPTVPKNAIDAGATWSSNHLVINGVAHWLTIDTSNAWQLASLPGIAIEQSNFNALAASTQQGPYLIVGGARKQLTTVTMFGSAWAVLVNA